MAGPWVIAADVATDATWSVDAAAVDSWNVATETSSEVWVAAAELDLRAEGNSWTLRPGSMNPSAAPNRSILNAGNWAAEEFNCYPENADIVPEQTQADNDGEGNSSDGWVRLSQETD